MELFNVKRIKNFRIATLRAAYHPDRLYAWTGRRGCPDQSVIQDTIETRDELVARAKREFAL